jgi:oxygen-dependent protoporphyrinogen oxidase
METTFAVVGGGISGIAATQSLIAQGHRAELIEAEASLGGRIGSGRFRGRDVEFGGKNIGKRYARFRELVRAFGGVQYDLFGINSSRQHRGSVLALDGSRRFRTTASYLRGPAAKDAVKVARHSVRILLNGANRFLSSPYFRDLAANRDEPLDRHFSTAFASTVIRPMTVRMNGAEPDEAFLGTVGTNLGMVLDTFEQLAHGLGTVLARMEDSMTVIKGRRVVSIDREGPGEVALSFEDGAVKRYQGVVLAVPAPAAGRIVERLSPIAGELLNEIRYFPVTVVMAEYARPIFAPDRRAYGFGAEHPLSDAGAYGVRDLNTVRYTFSGRTARAWMARASDEDLIQTAERLLSRHVPVDAGSRLGFAVRRFDPGLCAYSGEHARRLSHIQSALCRFHIAVAGDYVQGASLEACARSGQQAAAELVGPPKQTSRQKSLSNKGMSAHV